MGLNHEKDRGRKSRDNTLPVSHFKYYLRLSLCGLMLQPARWAAWWPSPHSYPTPRNVKEASSIDCSSRICSMHKSMLLKAVCVCLLRKEKGLIWQQILIQFFYTIVNFSCVKMYAILFYHLCATNIGFFLNPMPPILVNAGRILIRRKRSWLDLDRTEIL